MRLVLLLFAFMLVSGAVSGRETSSDEARRVAFEERRAVLKEYLGKPTVNEFSSFVGISAPNAAYKINNLIQKGYVRKEQSKTDKREYHLVVTQKYIDYYNISYGYLSTVMDRIKARFPAEDVAKIEEMLG